MDGDALELVQHLLDRVEALEKQVSKHEEQFERHRRRFFPDEAEVEEDGKQYRKLGLPSAEESYILIWGSERFEKVWGQPAAPFIEKMRADGRI